MFFAMNRVLLGVAIGLVPLAYSALAQEAEREERIVTQVITVNHLRPGAAQVLLDELYSGELYSLTQVEGRNLLVAHGPESAVAAAVKLLEQVDVDDSSQRAGTARTEFVRLRAIRSRNWFR